MTYGQNEKGESGLVFPSELDDSNGQSILFTVPIIEPFTHPMDIVEYMESHTFYFPFLLNEKYIELEARGDFPDLLFNIPETQYQIVFEIDTDNLNTWQYFYYSRRFKLPWRNKSHTIKYVGTNDKLILPKTSGFIPIAPVDLYEMDELYLEHKGIFVGLTPSFGMESFLNLNR